MTVDGVGSTWTSIGAGLSVGNGGAGTMTVQNGGAVNLAGSQVVVGAAAGSVGNLTVTGNGSTFAAGTGFVIGSAGTGTLTLSAGGKANGSSGMIGSSGSGTVLVDGAGSKWLLTGNLMVANLGTGVLNITNGGAVSSGSANLGFDAGSTATVTVAGTGSQWTNTGALVIGDLGSGSLAISGGGLVSNADGTIGAQAGSTGTVTVDGTGSTWTNNGNLQVGGAGTGSLTISNSAVVNATAGATVIESSAAGATPAMLSILSGAKLNSSFSTVGGTGGTQGSVVVDGTGSNWTSSFAGLSAGLTVGDAGTGTLAITNGGTVNNVDGVIGSQGGSTGTASVAGANSQWTNSGDLMVADAGAGTLAITNGGAVKNGFGLIANQAGATGDVTVDGAGSTWTNGFGVIVGNSGAGTLTISNGGTVKAANTVFIAGAAGGTGALNIGGAAGAAATAPGILLAPLGVQFGAGTGALNFNHTDVSGNYAFDAAITGLGTINQVAGWTNLTGSSPLFTGQVNVSGGRLAVNGSLASAQLNVSSTGILGGTGFVGNTFANAGGIIAPGNSIGTLNVNGNVTFAAGSFYQVETNPAGQSDNLLVSGTATINGGTVQVIGGSGQLLAHHQLHHPDGPGRRHRHLCRRHLRPGFPGPEPELRWQRREPHADPQQHANWRRGPEPGADQHRQRRAEPGRGRRGLQARCWACRRRRRAMRSSNCRVRCMPRRAA